MRHKISGQILEQIVKDPNKILFIDTSDYVITPENPVLRLTPPDWDRYFDIEYIINGITMVTPYIIGHRTFPDGVYTFVQSVKPNTQTEVTFTYFHKENIELELIEQIENNLDNPTELERLYRIKMEISILNNLKPEQAKEIYKNLKIQLDECKQAI